MKYLEKSFTLPVTDKHPESRLERSIRLGREQIRKNNLPHEFEGANMCLVCGLDAKAKIHEPQLV